MRRLLVILGVLLVAVLVLDFAARAYAENRTADAIQTGMGLAAHPEVSFGGFPFLPRVLAGTVPSMTVTVQDFTAESLPVERLEVSVRTIRFQPGDLLSGSGTIRADHGKGTAMLTGEAVTAALRGEGIAVDVRFEEDRVIVSLDQVPEPVEGRASIEDGRLVVRGDALPVDVQLALPQLVRGIRFTDGRVEDSRAVIGFVLTDTTFEV
jgi:hypothetical protein